LRAETCLEPLMPVKSRKTTLARTLAFALTLVAAVTALVAFHFSTATASKSTVLGAIKNAPAPLCPAKKTGGCSVMGTVTGFGVSANGNKGLYRIPNDGHIVAWSVDMGKPDKTEVGNIIAAIGEHKKYGTAPVARLAILKHKKSKKGKSKSRYTLAKQSPVIDLGPNEGHKPIYTLNKPLKVKKGQVAALTVPTYAPAYTNKVSPAANAWKASRPSDKCGEQYVAEAKPHLRKGTTRNYGCTLSGEQILYYAYFVANKGGNGGNGGNGGGGQTDPNRATVIGPDAGAPQIPTVGGIAG